MAASSALFIVCRSGCDLTSMCVMVLVLVLTTRAPKVELALTCDPSM